MRTGVVPLPTLGGVSFLLVGSGTRFSPENVTISIHVPQIPLKNEEIEEVHLSLCEFELRGELCPLSDGQVLLLTELLLQAVQLLSCERRSRLPEDRGRDHEIVVGDDDAIAVVVVVVDDIGGGIGG